jgi:hypothetical protein
MTTTLVSALVLRILVGEASEASEASEIVAMTAVIR